MKYFLDIFSDSDKELTKEEISHTIRQINGIAYAILNEVELSVYVRNYQKALIDWKENNKYAIAADEILFSLESTFPDYLVKSLASSEQAKCSLFIDNWEAGIIQTIISVLSITNLEICYPLFSVNKTTKLSLHQYQYLKTFYPFLIKNFLRNERLTEENYWEAFLFSANFNHLGFTHSLTNKIIEKVSAEDYIENQLEILLEYRKDYSHIQVEIPIPYDFYMPSADKQITDWLDIEIKYLKKKLQRRIQNQSVLEFKPISKIKTSMSVAQLIYLFKILREAGIVTNPVLQDMLKAVHESFITEKVGEISLKSLANKFYDVDSITKEQVKKILKEVLGLVN